MFTGRKYGLKRDLWVDERSDFEKATRAAAAYLNGLDSGYGTASASKPRVITAGGCEKKSLLRLRQSISLNLSGIE